MSRPKAPLWPSFPHLYAQQQMSKKRQGSHCQTQGREGDTCEMFRLRCDVVRLFVLRQKKPSEPPMQRAENRKLSHAGDQQRRTAEWWDWCGNKIAGTDGV